MMKLFIRAHDLGVRNEDGIIEKLDAYGLDGVQLVAYKCLDGVTYTPGSVTAARAEQFRQKFAAAGKSVPLIGAYFNPVHCRIQGLSAAGGRVRRLHCRLGDRLL